MRANRLSNSLTQRYSSVVLKVGMLGDAQVGKTSLMVKYVEGRWRISPPFKLWQTSGG